MVSTTAALILFAQVFVSILGTLRTAALILFAFIAPVMHQLIFSLTASVTAALILLVFFNFMDALLVSRCRASATTLLLLTLSAIILRLLNGLFVAFGTSLLIPFIFVSSLGI